PPLCRRPSRRGAAGIRRGLSAPPSRGGGACRGLPPAERADAAALRRRRRGAGQHRLGRTRLSAYWRPVLASAAAVVLAASLGAGVTEVFDARSAIAPEPVPSFAETAARLHTFYAGAEPTEFGADSAAKLNTLLDKRLGAPLRLPDLTPKGFSLLGGRVLPSPGGA